MSSFIKYFKKYRKGGLIMDKQNIKLHEGFAKGLNSIYNICKNHKKNHF